MDPLAARLSKLSVSNRRQAKRGRNRRGPATSGVQSPASGLRTPVSGLQTPASGVLSKSSGVSTPDEESDAGSDEEDEEEEEERQPFPFFQLPYELRHKILCHLMMYNKTVDLNVNATWRIRMMPVSRQFYRECCIAFYGANMFRLLPLDGPVLKKRTRPLIQFFSARNRALITRLELRLGPHWEHPPICWQIQDKLGIEDLTSLRRLDIFVQTDPEHPSFAGFRRSKDFYTVFSGELLSEIVKRAPSLETVYIDSYPAIGRDSPLLRRLESVTIEGSKKVVWSGHLRLEDCYDMVTHPAPGVSIYDTVVIRQMVMAD